MTDNESRMLIFIPKEANYIEILGHRIDGFDSFEAFCEHLKKYAELEETVNRLQAENEKNENIIRLADKTIETANAEVERLQKENENFANIGKMYSEIKAEAYKEFVEELCKDRVSNDPVVIAAKCLLKEMVGEENG